MQRTNRSCDAIRIRTFASTTIVDGKRREEHSGKIPLLNSKCTPPGFIACAFNKTGWAFWLQLALHSNGPCSGFAPDSPSASASTVRRLSPMQLSTDPEARHSLLWTNDHKISNKCTSGSPCVGQLYSSHKVSAAFLGETIRKILRLCKMTKLSLFKFSSQLPVYISVVVI